MPESKSGALPLGYAPSRMPALPESTVGLGCSPKARAAAGQAADRVRCGATPPRRCGRGVLRCGMRYRFELGPREATLILCTAALVALVYAEGWIWPLKAAAVMIPLSLVIG